MERPPAIDALLRETWRMPPLAKLPPAKLSLARQDWMAALRVYLVVAGGLVLVRIVMLAIGATEPPPPALRRRGVSRHDDDMGRA